MKEAYPFDIDTGLEGNFVNGFYESEHIRYGEANFGSPLLSQSLLNLPNLKEIRVMLDGELFSMEEGSVEEYSRTLHMKEGILERKLDGLLLWGIRQKSESAGWFPLRGKISWLFNIR